MLRGRDFDVAAIMTPDHLHEEMAVEAFKAGKHVFCEKPMARTVADARAMAEAARRTGLVLQIGYPMRHSPDALNLRQLILDGRIGRPVWFRDIWALSKGNPSPSTHDREIGGGVIYELAHWLDFVSFLFGRATKVYAVTARFKPDPTTADDTFLAVIQFASGDTAIWSESWAAKGLGYDVPPVGRKVRPTLDVIGPKGSIHFPGPSGEKLLSLYESKDQSGAPTEQWVWESDWGANASGYAAELVHFYRAVRESIAPVPSGEEALAANVLAEAIVESGRTGEPVRLT
jgi:predicted dehydrogenase